MSKFTQKEEVTNIFTLGPVDTVIFEPPSLASIYKYYLTNQEDMTLVSILIAPLHSKLPTELICTLNRKYLHFNTLASNHRNISFKAAQKEELGLLPTPALFI